VWIEQEERQLGGVEIRPRCDGRERWSVGSRALLIDCDKMAACAPSLDEVFALIRVGRESS
jgi:hypothetical protein